MTLITVTAKREPSLLEFKSSIAEMTTRGFTGHKKGRRRQLTVSQEIAIRWILSRAAAPGPLLGRRRAPGPPLRAAGHQHRSGDGQGSGSATARTAL
jgi:hypothetical protein